MKMPEHCFARWKRKSTDDSYSVGANWTHDQVGRINQENRSMSGAGGKHDTDGYNLDGSLHTMSSLGYTSTYVYSPVGRPVSVTTDYANMHAVSATYAPFGGLTSMSLGPTPTLVTNVYNNRLQPLLLSAVAGSTTVMSLCYDFHSGVALSSAPCSFPGYTSGNNGNVFQIVNNRDNTRTQNFTYDSLNRISQASSSGTNWGEAFTIDPWGNLTNRAGVTGKSNTEPLNASATAQNRLTGYGYDAAGNMTSNGSASYVYDAENRLIATAGMSYIYDGDGKRVEKCTEGTTPGTCASGATGTLYWMAWGNDPLIETDLAGNSLESYVFFNGQRIARRDVSTGAIHFYFSDHLGSHGVVTNMAGTTCEQDIDYYPYGGVENDYCPSVAQHYKFTGKERDGESGLDYFGARHNASNLGRFMTPDWSNEGDPVPYADLEDPQSLNLYAYTENDPTAWADPDGHDPGGDNGAPPSPIKCGFFLSLFGLGPCGGGGGNGSGSGSRTPNSDKNPLLPYTLLGDAISSGEAKLQSAKTALDTFNAVAGFGKTNCAGGRDCLNALGMAATSVFIAVDSGGESEEVNAEKLLKEAGPFVNFARNELLSAVTDQGLKDVIDNLLRPNAGVGDGSSMAAFREEVQTGAKVGGRSHGLKLIERRTQLMRLYRSGRLNPTDRAIAKGLLIAIQDALSTRPPI
jgi:RHS repeat-associated protein